jgi:ornithine cyclodeaminase/alanine dehydrogenase-like protein (mu-crystallin family)
MSAAIDALETAFAADTLPEAPLRSHLETPGGTLLMMPSHGAPGVGVKLVTLTPSNADRGLPFIHAAYVLFDPETQALRAVFDGAALTALRTGAVSGLATRHLAREDARRLVLYGAGVQARSHLDAMRAVRAIDELVVVGRGRENVDALVDAATASGLSATAGEPGAEGDADIVCTTTTSTEPVVFGRELRDGVHLNAVGAYTTSMRELDATAVARAKVVVETRDAADAEAGDLALALAEGAIGPGHVAADLHELVTGTVVRASDADVTLFKSVGVAFEDLVVASAALDRLAGGAA